MGELKKTQATLNATEQRLCRYVAKMRYKNNRAAGVTNSKLGNQSSEQTELEGISAEIAFCKLNNLYPNLTIDTCSAKKGQDSFDAVLDGKTIDVKTTTYRNGKLLAVPWKTYPPDFYALMVGTFPTYRFKGFMAGSRLLAKGRLTDLGHGLTYIAFQVELAPTLENV